MARGMAEQILGGAVRFKADISLMKPARIGEATPWHQDEAFQDPAFDYEEVSFWLALQPVNEANSCMAYLPGSHKGPVLPHGFPGNDPRIHALECISGFDPRDAVECPLPAGGCVIHNGRTVHGAGPNLSDQRPDGLCADLRPGADARLVSHGSFPGASSIAPPGRSGNWSGGGTAACWCISGGSEPGAGDQRADAAVRSAPRRGRDATGCARRPTPAVGRGRG